MAPTLYESGIMKLLSIAIAACSFDLSREIPGDNTVWIQVTPQGKFLPSDGRKMTVPHWYIDAAVAARVIERFNRTRNERVVDYEHQTLYKEENGKEAPAAGWMRQLQWREGQGLFAQVELTGRAAQYVADREYRYFSPVFLYHSKSGEVLDVSMGALTNTPAIDGMEELELLAAATFGIDPKQEEPPMNELLKALRAALGLPENATESEALAALSAHLKALRKTLDLEDSANGEAVIAACTGLKAKAKAQSADPDPSKFIAIEAFDELKGELAALSAKFQERESNDVDTMIKTALEDGRLMKVQESWARDLAKSNVAALSSYLKTAQPLAAIKGSQTGGKDPAPDEETGLTEDEMAVCSRMGLTHEQFKAVKEG